MPYGITQCHMPAIRDDIPTLNICTVPIMFAELHISVNEYADNYEIFSAKK